MNNLKYDLLAYGNVDNGYMIIEYREKNAGINVKPAKRYLSIIGTFVMPEGYVMKVDISNN